MTHPTTIAAEALVTVTGGKDTGLGGSLTLPGGFGSASYSSRRTLALQACSGLSGSPQNPRTSGDN